MPPSPDELIERVDELAERVDVLAERVDALGRSLEASMRTVIAALEGRTRVLERGIGLVGHVGSGCQTVLLRALEVPVLTRLCVLALILAGGIGAVSVSDLGAWAATLITGAP